MTAVITFCGYPVKSPKKVNFAKKSMYIVVFAN